MPSWQVRPRRMTARTASSETARYDEDAEVLKTDLCDEDAVEFEYDLVDYIANPDSSNEACAQRAYRRMRVTSDPDHLAAYVGKLRARYGAPAERFFDRINIAANDDDQEHANAEFVEDAPSATPPAFEFDLVDWIANPDSFTEECAQRAYRRLRVTSDPDRLAAYEDELRARYGAPADRFFDRIGVTADDDVPEQSTAGAREGTTTVRAVAKIAEPLVATILLLGCALLVLHLMSVQLRWLGVGSASLQAYGIFVAAFMGLVACFFLVCAVLCGRRAVAAVREISRRGRAR